jgi:hypothetical protein
MFLANIYKKAKKSFLLLFTLSVSLILLSFISNDLISVSSGISIYILLSIKWLGVLILLGLIGYNIIKIINIATSPFEKTEVSSISMKKNMQDLKKEHILNKDQLLTKSDLIIKKYQGVCNV